jgi:hypothetical protein
VGGIYCSSATLAERLGGGQEEKDANGSRDDQLGGSFVSFRDTASAVVAIGRPGLGRPGLGRPSSAARRGAKIKGWVGPGYFDTSLVSGIYICDDRAADLNGFPFWDVSAPNSNAVLGGVSESG